MKGSKDIHHNEVKVRLTDEDWEKLELASRLTGIPRAVIIRSVWKSAVENGVREFFLSEDNRRGTVA